MDLRIAAFNPILTRLPDYAALFERISEHLDSSLGCAASESVK
jgi:hypothetical protein